MPHIPRNIEVDAIRTFALIGICIVNIPFHGLTVTQQLVPHCAQQRALSHAVARKLVSPEGAR
ncbi:MAG: hypothetical protein MUF47_13275 [Porphyrobacter sp.]|nr:hypothetical protein [Porphyrobacter sp.]